MGKLMGSTKLNITNKLDMQMSVKYRGIINKIRKVKEQTPCTQPTDKRNNYNRPIKNDHQVYIYIANV
jgi:ribosomal protein S30